MQRALAFPQLFFAERVGMPARLLEQQIALLLVAFRTGWRHVIPTGIARIDTLGLRQLEHVLILRLGLAFQTLDEFGELVQLRRRVLRRQREQFIDVLAFTQQALAVLFALPVLVGGDIFRHRALLRRRFRIQPGADARFRQQLLLTKRVQSPRSLSSRWVNTCR